MRTLHPFTAHTDPLGVQGKLELAGNELYLEFQLADPLHLVLDSLAPGSRPDPFRAHGLWNTTCFEAFWGVPGEKSYWELNLSGTHPKWNLYHFTEYRHPAEPTESDDFAIKSWSVSPTSLHCQLAGRHQLGRIEASLCTILRTSKGTHFYSTKHAGEQADFHLRKSITIELG
jgi:hypothetical protein